MTESMQSIEELFSHKVSTTASQWKIPESYQITALEVGRDEEIWDESEIAHTFLDDVPVDVKCPAILFAPGKVVVALTLVEG